MKILRLLIALSLALCCTLTIVACSEAEGLPQPKNLAVEPTSLTLTWNAVKDARMYTVSIQREGQEAKELGASKNSYSLSSLEEGVYKIKVKANGRGEDVQDSPWSKELVFERERETGLVMTLINNDTAYEVTNKGTATGDIVIPDTYRGRPVTAIGKKAFFNKNDVTGVTLGANIKTIGEFAFGNCSYLANVQLPAGLTSIGKNAFSSCRLIKGELVIPDSVTEIGENAFSYCVGLTSVKLGSGLTSLGNNAFTDCAELTSVEMGDSLLSVGSYAFAACAKLTTVRFGGQLQSIGDFAFLMDTALNDIELPDSLITIGEGAFKSCSGLSDVKLGSGLRSMNYSAFRDTALWHNTESNEIYVDNWFLTLKDPTAAFVSFREDTYAIADYAFEGCLNLVDVYIETDSLKLIGNQAFASTNIISIVIGGGVESIGEKAFAYCQSLTNVKLGKYLFATEEIVSSSLKSIGSYAFAGCSSLTEIEIPSTVAVIGTYVFNGSGLPADENGLIYADNWLVGYTDAAEDDVVLREGTVGIANYAFNGCYKMTSVVVPDSVKTIGRAAFYKCDYLSRAVLPETLEKIEDYTFYCCSSLKLLKLPSMLTYIGRSAFYECGQWYMGEDENLDTAEDVLTIPGNVTYIGDYAFYGCSQEPSEDTEGNIRPAQGIDTIVIGDGVVTIGKNAFYGFSSLKKVVLGNSVQIIGEKAFYKCPSLAEVTFGTSLRQIGSKAFYRCEALKAVQLPDSLTEIGTHAFYRCTAVEQLVLGNGVVNIGGYAFYGCAGVKEIVIPASVRSIGTQAFRNCKGVGSVVLSSAIETIEAHAFYGCSTLTMYVEATALPEGWHARWNSSYRPVIFGCTLSEDKDYVVALPKQEGSILNRNSSNSISDPVRAGYTFGGWGTHSTAVEEAYTSATLDQAPDQRTLYAIWLEK